LLPDSVPAQALRRVVAEADLLLSEETLAELSDVLGRSKFDAYIAVAERQSFIRLLGHIAELVPIIHTVKVCRDPHDDKFLALAVNGGADAIVTGDNDLLALDPFHDIAIQTPLSYLSRR
jgi:putative PIN family toxin of toxin-antitoxin system